MLDLLDRLDMEVWYFGSPSGTFGRYEHKFAVLNCFFAILIIRVTVFAATLALSATNPSYDWC